MGYRDTTDTPEAEAAENGAVEQWVDHVRRELRNRVRLASMSQRQIEEIAHWRRGYLSQVLQGKMTLTMAHVLTVLDALGLPFLRFFEEVFPGPRELPAADEIRDKLVEYDAAFAQLRRAGLLVDDDGGGTVETGGTVEAGGTVDDDADERQ